MNGNWEGELNGKTGHFPFTHVEFMEDQSMNGDHSTALSNNWYSSTTDAKNKISGSSRLSSIEESSARGATDTSHIARVSSETDIYVERLVNSVDRMKLPDNEKKNLEPNGGGFNGTPTADSSSLELNGTPTCSEDSDFEEFVFDSNLQVSYSLNAHEAISRF